MGTPPGPHARAFVAAMADRTGAAPGTFDLVLVAAGTPFANDLDLHLVPATDDEIAAELCDAPNPRHDARVWHTADGRGRLVLGRGLEDRWEIAIEVAPQARGQGLGRRLATAARGLVAPDEVVCAQIAPGNIASLRAAAAAGYRPIAAEILFFG